MKVKCEAFRDNGHGECRKFDKCRADCAGYGFMNVSASTQDLISALETKKPCGHCYNWTHDGTPCRTCLWPYVQTLKSKVDNFKGNQGE